MTTLTMLSFQEKGHGLFNKKEENWTHEGPRYSKEKEKKFGHMKVQCVSKER